MSRNVAIIDYGVGNLLSVARAVTAAGGSPFLACSPDEVAKADRLLLPGVGAFGHCIDTLTARGLVEPILSFAAGGRPFLGICVGMQILFDESTEFGLHRGLGLIAGRVERIPAEGRDGRYYKIPYVGWNPLLRPTGRESWRGTVLEDTREGSWAYFTHSYVAVPVNDADCLAEGDYFGHRRATAVVHENLSACQFHPEKSGPAGLAILSRFLSL